MARGQLRAGTSTGRFPVWPPERRRRLRRRWFTLTGRGLGGADALRTLAEEAGATAAAVRAALESCGVRSTRASR